MEGESTRLGLPQVIKECGWIGEVFGPCEVKHFDVSAKWGEVGRVQGPKFWASDLQGFAEMCASATNPSPGYERQLYQSFWVVVEEVDDVVHQFLCQISLLKQTRYYC